MVDTLAVFSKLLHVITSESTEGALPFHSCWVGSMVLIHMVLQSLRCCKIYRTEWTLVNMGSGMLPKFSYCLKLLVTEPTPNHLVLMFP